MTPKGWHSRGYLPHFDSPETLQFVTFLLFDSLPAEAIEKMRLMPSPGADADRDAFLDAGAGNCWLKHSEIATVVQDALLHFDGERYRLLAWTVMPNHVHVLIEPLRGHALGGHRQFVEALFGANGESLAEEVRIVLARRLLGHLHPK